MWLGLLLGKLWIWIGIFTQFWYINCCRFNWICEKHTESELFLLCRHLSLADFSVWVRLPPLTPFCYNLGAVSLSLHIFVGRVDWIVDTLYYSTTHEFLGLESDNNIFLRVCRLSTLCFGDELIKSSKSAYADIWAHHWCVNNFFLAKYSTV